MQELIGWCVHHGISKTELFENYYPDEILLIREFVEMHKARDMMVHFNITMAPHMKDPTAMRDALAKQCGPGISTPYWQKSQLNVAQFEKLRAEMNKAHNVRRG